MELQVGLKLKVEVIEKADLEVAEELKLEIQVEVVMKLEVEEPQEVVVSGVGGRRSASESWGFSIFSDWVFHSH